jgi:hypothetical protein
VVLAAYAASTAGLGYTVVTAASQLSTPRLYDAVVITVLGIPLTEVFRQVEKHFLAGASNWQRLTGPPGRSAVRSANCPTR